MKKNMRFYALLFTSFIGMTVYSSDAQDNQEVDLYIEQQELVGAGAEENAAAAAVKASAIKPVLGQQRSPQLGAGSKKAVAIKPVVGQSRRAAVDAVGAKKPIAIKPELRADHPLRNLPKRNALRN